MKPGLTAAVMKLLKGCSPIDVAWLTREDALCTNLYCLEQVSSDPEAGYEAYHPDSCEVPWPVLLLPGAHSRKHIFERTQKMNLQKLGHQLGQFDRRLRLAYTFRNEAEGSTYEKPLLKKEEVAPCKLFWTAQSQHTARLYGGR